MRAADSPAENRHITGLSGSQPRVFPGFFFFKNYGVWVCFYWGQRDRVLPKICIRRRYYKSVLKDKMYKLIGKNCIYGSKHN